MKYNILKSALISFMVSVALTLIAFVDKIAILLNLNTHFDGWFYVPSPIEKCVETSQLNCPQYGVQIGIPVDVFAITFVILFLVSLMISFLVFLIKKKLLKRKNIFKKKMSA